MTPTGEQAAILDLYTSTDSNLLINALAGTGKTATLELLINSRPAEPSLYLAFNKKIAEEARDRFTGPCEVRTFNALGHRIWAKTQASKLALEPKKIQNYLGELIRPLKGDDRREVSDAYWDIISAVGLAKSLGYIPNGKFPNARRLIQKDAFYASLDEKPTPLIASTIDSLLVASIKSAYEGLIDYNDQIYMPALFGGTFPRFPCVLVDEAQDLSPTNHAMLDKLARQRICAVGDPWQSIYAFRGAVQRGMQSLSERFDMQEANLSISFRCPRVIVEAAGVPGFRWVKEGGRHETLQMLEPSRFQEGSAIICRNNAPLFKCAFGLLASGRSVSVAGSEIGPKLISIMRKLGADGDSRAKVIAAIATWEDEKLSRTQRPAMISDMAECLRIFASFGTTLAQAVAYAEHLFAQRGTIRLLTGHKAKGLEFDTVYHLDPWLIGKGEQEANLRYVITTRSRDRLYEINSRDILWV